VAPTRGGSLTPRMACDADALAGGEHRRVPAVADTREALDGIQGDPRGDVGRTEGRCPGSQRSGASGSAWGGCQEERDCGERRGTSSCWLHPSFLCASPTFPPRTRLLTRMRLLCSPSLCRCRTSASQSWSRPNRSVKNTPLPPCCTSPLRTLSASHCLPLVRNRWST